MPTKKTSAGSTPSTPSTSPAAPRAPKRQAKASNGNGGLTALPVASASDRKTALANEPTREQIAEAAYLRYLQRGGSHGQDFNDWLEAERELKDRTR